jgi:hypothetical protein
MDLRNYTIKKVNNKKKDIFFCSDYSFLVYDIRECESIDIFVVLFT